MKGQTCSCVLYSNIRAEQLEGCVAGWGQSA